MIKEMRIKKKMTLEALAKKSGVSRASLNRYELGTRVPNVHAAMKIARALECSVEELFSETGKKGA